MGRALLAAAWSASTGRFLILRAVRAFVPLAQFRAEQGACLMTGACVVPKARAVLAVPATAIPVHTAVPVTMGIKNAFSIVLDAHTMDSPSADRSCSPAG